MDAWLDVIRYGLHVARLDAELNNLYPYPTENYFIVAVYDPMQACTFTKEMMYMMKRNGFLEDKVILIKSTNIFESAGWLPNSYDMLSPTTCI